MKVYDGKDIRNVALVGHGHSGKTMLTSALLYASGTINRLTRPDEGNTVTDYDDEEIQRKMTISTGVAAAEWKKTKLNLLDTPGFTMFLHDTTASMKVSDAALVLVDGVAGVEVQTAKVCALADEFRLPRAFLVNKLDRERADFQRAVASIHEACGRAAIPIHLPIGSEKHFSGIIDVISMKSYTYTANGDGKGKVGEIPPDLIAAATSAHEALIELIAEGDDKLMEEFFAEGTLPVDHIIDGMKHAIYEDRLFPVLCGSAAQNIGTDLLLDFMVEFFPAPVDREKMLGISMGTEVHRAIQDSSPLSVFVFKTAADPFAGRVSFFKVCSGVLKNDDHVQNSRSNGEERLAHIGSPQGKTIQQIPQMHAGDIGVVAKLRDTMTGDTLYTKPAPIAYLPLQVPEPSIAYAIEAKSRNDEDRMGNALHKILEEDLSLRFYRDPQTKEFLLAGNGQQHIEIIVSRLKKRYGVDVELHAPKIPYRETVRGTAQVQGRHKKQTGGHGQFGDCWIRIEPLPRGERFQFANEVFGGAIPRNFIPAIEKGIVETAANGYLAGYPVVDFKVTVYDGSYHDVDSSEMAFKLAARKAFKAAMEHAKPSLLEPIMRIEVHAPVEFAGDLMSDMNGRRGRISGMDTQGLTQHIRAQVPMSEILSYQNDLTSMTQGRASFSMEFDHYDYVPQPQAEKIIAAARAARGQVIEEDE